MAFDGSVLLDLADELFVVLDSKGLIEHANRRWSALGLPATPNGLALRTITDTSSHRELASLLALEDGQCCTQTLQLATDGGHTEFRFRGKRDGSFTYLVGREANGRKRVPTDQPLLAGRLQSVGELAAGIAHEINTPIQFIGNNLDFLEGAFQSTFNALEETQRIVATIGDCPEVTGRLLSKVDIGLLAAEVPSALSESIAGIARISEIVRAMNEFTHPQASDKRLVDLHKLIRTAVAMSRSAWKYVAEIELKLDDTVPLILAYGAGLGQVVLNLIINASHAIEEATPTGARGTIKISTSHEAGRVLLVVADSGCGMDESLQSQIFDPFFTTKEAGRGSGQGLAIVHREIAERHRGSINVVSTPGSGTEFHIGIPIDESPQHSAGEIAC